MAKIPQEQLKELLFYDPVKGDFHPYIRCGTKNYVSCSSLVDRHNFSQPTVVVGRHTFPAARLAWFYSHGVWPERRMKYLDFNQGNLALSNLTTRPGRHPALADDPELAAALS